MTKAEKYRLRKQAEALPEEELKDLYYKAVLATLGSEAEMMYERGYDIRDCIEMERLERDLIIRADILEMVCEDRGITLWEDFQNG